MRVISNLEPAQGKLLMRKRVLGNKEAWIFFNPSEKDVSEEIAIGDWKTPSDLLGGKIERKGERLIVTVDGLDMRAIILQK